MGRRILHVLHNYPPEFLGGVERYVVTTAAAQAARGDEPVVVAGSERGYPEPTVLEEIHDGIPVFRLVRGPLWRSPLDPAAPELVPLYEGLLDRLRPELVHVHHWWNLGVDLVRRAARRGIPTVVTLHDFFSTCALFFRMPDGRTPCREPEGPEACTPCVAGRFQLDPGEIAFRTSLRTADFRAEIRAAGEVLVPSASHAEKLRGFLGVDRPMTVLELGSRPLPSAAAPPAHVPVTRLRLLHFGNLSRLKGVELLLHAVREADPSGERIDLVLAGEFVEQDLDPKPARHVGNYDAARLAALAAETDLAVFPSLAMESYGLVVDEALRLGLPVVVSDRGALAERLHGRGTAVPVDSSGPLAALLRSVLATPALLEGWRRAPLPPLLDPAGHAERLAGVYGRVPARGPVPLDLESSLLARVERASRRFHEIEALRAAALAAVACPAKDPEETPVTVPEARAFTDATTAQKIRARNEDPTGRLVSVIIRTRNRKELLVDAVGSVAAQRHPERELIVVNDGGEPVADVLSQFAERLTIRLLEPGRVGRCRAGNLGLEAARGTWIAFLDDDDLQYPDHLATMVTKLEARGMKVGYSDAHRIDQQRDGPEGPWREVSRSVPYSEDFSRIGLFRRAYIHLVTVVFHRECVERLGGFDESLEVLEDWDLFFRFAQDYDFLHVPEVTTAFRIRDDRSNAVTALRREFAETRTRLFARYIHVAFPELLGMVTDGGARLLDLERRVRLLEAERSGGSPERGS